MWSLLLLGDSSFATRGTQVKVPLPIQMNRVAVMKCTRERDAHKKLTLKEISDISQHWKIQRIKCGKLIPNQNGTRQFIKMQEKDLLLILRYTEEAVKLYSNYSC